MKSLKAMIPIVVAVLIVVGAAAAIIWLPASILNAIRGFFGDTTSLTVSTSETIVRGIQPLGQLVSVNTQLAKANIDVNIQFGAGGVCKIYSSYVGQATVEAGIDLTKIGDSDITYDEETNTYTVLLPAPELTSCNLDPVQTQQYAHTGETPVCSPNWDEMRRIASYVALGEFRDDAVEAGVLQRAKREADIVLANFVTALTGSEVEIQFKEQSGDTTFPATCNPDVPNGWKLDEASGLWSRQ